MCFQSGKKTVKAVLWVSADGLRVVDDKTKVRKLFFYVCVTSVTSSVSREQGQGGEV